MTGTDVTDGLGAELELALELAQLGADIALPRFRDRDFTVTIKPDGSPVTDVDQAVERALRRRIAESNPDHAVTGEEYGVTGESEWRWYLDPIDGTSHYVAGDPLWMVLVALAHRRAGRRRRRPVPPRWASAGGRPATWRLPGRRADRRLAHRPAAQDAVVADDWRETLARGVTDHPLAVLASRAGGVLPHEGYNFLSVAAGRADVALGLGAFSWDYALATVIVEEAGGRFTDFDGGPRFRRAPGRRHQRPAARRGAGRAARVSVSPTVRKRPNQPAAEAARDVCGRHVGRRPTHLPASAVWDVCRRPRAHRRLRTHRRPGTPPPALDRRR